MERIIREAIIEGIVTLMIVHNELLYTVDARIVRVRYSIKEKYSFGKHVTRQDSRRRPWIGNECLARLSVITDCYVDIRANAS